jgi:uncharacterized repeat protein (TIGR04042 family)
MTETTFRIRWPDGQIENCYSPSTVVHEHFAAGETYRLDDFLARSQRALDAAALRVRQKYGFRCGIADAQAARIAATAKGFQPGAAVQCLSIN